LTNYEIFEGWGNNFGVDPYPEFLTEFLTGIEVVVRMLWYLLAWRSSDVSKCS